MSWGTNTIRDTGEEARKRKRRDSRISERWERKEKKKSRSEERSRSRDPRCDGVIGYELTGAKGPSRTPLRRGSRRRKLRGGNRFITKRGERRRCDFARGTNNSVDTPRPSLTRCLFCACTHFMLLALLPRPPAPLSLRPFYFFAQHVDDERSRDIAVPSFVSLANRTS